ncbi:MAG: M36 family metallopeptidase [Flavobacteriales bacterium]
MQLFSSARRWRVFIVLSSAFCTLDLDAQKGDALGLVIQQWTKQGGAASDLEGALQSSNYTDPGTGVVHTYLRQRAAGIPVFPGIFGVHTAADGTLLKWDVPPVAGLKEKAVDPLPVVTARAALENVAAQERVQMPGLEEVAYDAEQRRTTFRHSDSDEDPTVALVWWPTKEGVTLAWQVDVPSNDGAHWWIVLVDAKNGALLARYDRVISCSFGAGPCSVAAHTGPEGPSCLPAPPPPPGTPNSYSVFAFPARHPEDGVRSTVTAPWSLAPNASPFGWHDTNGAPGADHTNTTGNNVRAYHDTLAQNLPRGSA